MRWTRIVWAAPLVGLALAACATASADPTRIPTFATATIPPGEDFRSGTRLRARAYSAEGGASVFLGWHDAELDIACAFATTADGARRCLPYRVDVMYTDDACTKAVFAQYLPACGDPPPPSTLLTTYAPSTTCEVRPPIVRRIGPKLGRTSEFFYFAGTECKRNASAIAPAAERDLYELGEVVDASVFVRVASVAREAHGSGYVVERTVAEDGAMALASSAIDAARDAPCRSMAIEGALRCIPTSRATTGRSGDQYTYASDAACKSGVAQGGTCARPPAVVLVSPSPVSKCEPATPSFAEVGAPVQGPLFQRSLGPEACVPRVPVTTTSLPPSYYAIGAPIAVSSFPVQAIGVEGSSRVRLQTAVTIAGERLHATGFFDAERSAACRPAKVDGVLRCVPTNALSIATFADGACTRPLAEVQPGCKPTETVGVASRPPSGQCERPFDYVEIRGRASPERVWFLGIRDVSGVVTCSEIGPAPGNQYYETTALPMPSFPELMPTIDAIPDTHFHEGPPEELK